MTEFDDWFVKKYGNEPYRKKSLHDLWINVKKATSRLKRAQSELTEKERWIELREAALRAWGKGKDGESP